MRQLRPWQKATNQDRLVNDLMDACVHGQYNFGLPDLPQALRSAFSSKNEVAAPPRQDWL